MDYERKEHMWKGPVGSPKTQQMFNKDNYYFVVSNDLTKAYFHNPFSIIVLPKVDLAPFTFTTYKSTRSHEGQSVVISFEKDQTTYVIYSAKGENLEFKKQKPPSTVPGVKCNFIFYLKRAPDGFFTLQTADGTERYLSCNEDHKAILKTVGAEVDETIKMHFQDSMDAEHPI